MKNHLPLEGITVLELGNSVAAPFAVAVSASLHVGKALLNRRKRIGDSQFSVVVSMDA